MKMRAEEMEAYSGQYLDKCSYWSSFFMLGLFPGCKHWTLGSAAGD